MSAGERRSREHEASRRDQATKGRTRHARAPTSADSVTATDIFPTRHKSVRTYLLVKLDVSRLELLLNVSSSEVVGELVVGVGHALRTFLGSEVSSGGSRHFVERHGLVLRVSDLVQVHVRDLLVNQVGRVVRRRVAGQFREVL